MKELSSDYPVFELVGEDSGDMFELIYELEPNVDRDGREYEMVGQFLENDDFYQGLSMITVVRRKADNKLFGYSWWNDISKHGETYMESNGDEFGLKSRFGVEDDYETLVTSYVFEPVEQYPITAYRKVVS